MFHVIITNNDTGEIALEGDYKVILAGVAHAEDDAVSVALSENADAREVAIATLATLKGIKDIFEGLPAMEEVILAELEKAAKGGSGDE